MKDSTSVARALAILEALDSSRRGMNVSEISRKLGLPKSSTHVIVRTLERLNYIQKPAGSRRYSLGLKAYGLGQAILQAVALAEKAHPLMGRLVEALNLTVHLAVRDKEQAICIQKLEPSGPISFDTTVGRHMPLHCTAVGKAILAFDDDDIRRDFLSKRAYMRHTPRTITSAQALRRELLNIRKKGYAVDDQEEEPQVRCIGVPVLDPCKRLIAALSVTGTADQLPREKDETVAAALTMAAAALAALCSPIRGQRPVFSGIVDEKSARAGHAS